MLAGCNIIVTYCLGHHILPWGQEAMKHKASDYSKEDTQPKNLLGTLNNS